MRQPWNHNKFTWNIHSICKQIKREERSRWLKDERMCTEYLVRKTTYHGILLTAQSAKFPNTVNYTLPGTTIKIHHFWRRAHARLSTKIGSWDTINKTRYHTETLTCHIGVTPLLSCWSQKVSTAAMGFARFALGNSVSFDKQHMLHFRAGHSVRLKGRSLFPWVFRSVCSSSATANLHQEHYFNVTHRRRISRHTAN